MWQEGAGTGALQAQESLEGIALEVGGAEDGEDVDGEVAQRIDGALVAVGSREVEEGQGGVATEIREQKGASGFEQGLLGGTGLVAGRAAG